MFLYNTYEHLVPCSLKIRPWALIRQTDKKWDNSVIMDSGYRLPYKQTIKSEPIFSICDLCHFWQKKLNSFVTSGMGVVLNTNKDDHGDVL